MTHCHTYCLCPYNLFYFNQSLFISFFQMLLSIRQAYRSFFHSLLSKLEHSQKSLNICLTLYVYEFHKSFNFDNMNNVSIFSVSNTFPLEENSNDSILLSATKLWIVIGCISALVFIAIVQAGCTIYKTARRPRPNHKVVIIPNNNIIITWHVVVHCPYFRLRVQLYPFTAFVGALGFRC